MYRWSIFVVLSQGQLCRERRPPLPAGGCHLWLGLSGGAGAAHWLPLGHGT